MSARSLLPRPSLAGLEDRYIRIMGSALSPPSPSEAMDTADDKRLNAHQHAMTMLDHCERENARLIAKVSELQAENERLNAILTAETQVADGLVNVDVKSKRTAAILGAKVQSTTDSKTHIMDEVNDAPHYCYNQKRIKRSHSIDCQHIPDTASSNEDSSASPITSSAPAAVTSSSPAGSSHTHQLDNVDSTHSCKTELALTEHIKVLQKYKGMLECDLAGANQTISALATELDHAQAESSGLWMKLSASEKDKSMLQNISRSNDAHRQAENERISQDRDSLHKQLTQKCLMVEHLAADKAQLQAELDKIYQDKESIRKQLVQKSQAVDRLSVDYVHLAKENGTAEAHWAKKFTEATALLDSKNKKIRSLFLDNKALHEHVAKLEEEIRLMGSV